ncbi:MAG: LytR C-terminal domain-containing protein [Acidimicrobiia bacterium]|nr:LytR C-terminal domain-containing protein [Acidimicrobiia bacterium]
MPETEGRPAEPVTTQPAPSPVPQRKARGPVVLASLGALAILAGAVALSWFQLRDDGEAPQLPTPAIIGQAQSVVLVVAGEDGRATSLALFVSDGLEDHRLLVAPRDLTMQIPGYGDGSLGDALVVEDADLVRLSLVNELGVTIDEAITLSPGDVATLLGEPVRVDLPNPFIINTPEGNVVSAGAGSDVFVPETAETLLQIQGTDSPLDWLLRQRAVWEAITDQIAASSDGAVSLSPSFGPLVEHLGEAVVSVLPVDRVGVGISELYVVSRDADLLNERIAFLALSATERPRVEILNGTTLPGVTRPLAESLIEAGFRVIKTENADERFRRDSLIIAQGVSNQQAALDVQALLGGGDVVVQSSGSGVVDVSIIVGRDIATR